MTTITTTRSFEILDSSAKYIKDVFDHLISVRDVETGEEGLLLCSSCCAWPSHLIDQATWIEGCKTPIEYKDDPRLAMGFHPDSYTQWKVFKETNTIQLYLTGYWNQSEDDDTDFGCTSGLPFVPQSNWVDDAHDPINKSVNRLLKLFSRRKNRFDLQDALNFIESTVHRLVNSGAITPAIATCIGFYILCNYPDDIIHWEGSKSLFTDSACEGGSYLYERSSLVDDAVFRRVYDARDSFSTLYVLKDCPDLGYMRCEGLVLQFDIYDNAMTVTKDLPEYGFATAVDIYFESDEFEYY